MYCVVCFEINHVHKPLSMIQINTMPKSIQYTPSIRRHQKWKITKQLVSVYHIIFFLQGKYELIPERLS